MYWSIYTLECSITCFGEIWVFFLLCLGSPTAKMNSLSLISTGNIHSWLLEESHAVLTGGWGTCSRGWGTCSRRWGTCSRGLAGASRPGTRTSFSQISSYSAKHHMAAMSHQRSLIDGCRGPCYGIRLIARQQDFRNNAIN